MERVASELCSQRIAVTGVVQGVGFRPFVQRLGEALGVVGEVANGMRGVEILVQGSLDAIESFVVGLREQAPSAARIDRIEREPLDRPFDEDRFTSRFTIASSGAGEEVQLAVGPDLAMCDDCRAELTDANDRRFGYPFLNCTACGPRYSIVEGLPYDRATTTMRAFSMCESCREEYEDPHDRRFHAQPIACPECGPRLAFEGVSEVESGSGDPLERAARAIRAGRCAAVLGLGGFHLCVDAGSPSAVARLRARKQRGAKPFAVMFADVASIERVAFVDEAERRLLTSPAAPIVLLRKRSDVPGIADEIAPGHPYLGCMVAYTPQHALLLERLDGRPVVATSGNRRDEPICRTLEEARERLGDLVDGGFLHHDRAIARPIDDSVARVLDGNPMLLRRARGYAPVGFEWSGFPEDGVDVALGAHLKNTVAVRTGRRVVFSPHVGDLATLEARVYHERAVSDLQELTRTRATRVVCDAHPDYASTLLAERLTNAPLRVPHHLAHVLAVACEHDLRGPFAAVAWDGTGYGENGGDADGNAIWGGEFFERTSENQLPCRQMRLRPFPLPGGERAIREPWRIAFGLVREVFGPGDVPNALRVRVTDTSDELLAASLRFAPRCSSVGRLFDAVAAMLGLCRVAEYEADAAVRLEHAALRALGSAPSVPAYPWGRRESLADVDDLDPRPMLEAIADDIDAGVNVDVIALRFHLALVESLVAFARSCHGAVDIILSGGCFQNCVLLESSIRGLRDAGYRPFWARQFPSNDGGLPLGQLTYADYVSREIPHVSRSPRQDSRST